MTAKTATYKFQWDNDIRFGDWDNYYEQVDFYTMYRRGRDDLYESKEPFLNFWDYVHWQYTKGKRKPGKLKGVLLIIEGINHEINRVLL
jgi:hypothetical protein